MKASCSRTFFCQRYSFLKKIQKFVVKYVISFKKYSKKQLILFKTKTKMKHILYLISSFIWYEHRKYTIHFFLQNTRFCPLNQKKILIFVGSIRKAQWRFELCYFHSSQLSLCTHSKIQVRVMAHTYPPYEWHPCAVPDSSAICLRL